MDPSVLLAITYVKETAAGGTAQTEQSTAADFNKLVCNSNDPYRAKRVR